MFPSITPLTGVETEPDATMQFVLQLNTTPQIGANFGYRPFCFPEGQETVNVLASITTADFERPTGQSWRNIFTIDRQGTSNPSDWEFTAKASGDRKQYSLTVQTSLNGDSDRIVDVLCSFGKGSGIPPGGPPPIHPVRLPTETGAYLMIDISEEANGYNQVLSL